MPTPLPCKALTVLICMSVLVRLMMSNTQSDVLAWLQCMAQGRLGCQANQGLQGIIA